MFKLLNDSLLESEILKDLYTIQADHQAFINYLFAQFLKPMRHP